MVKGSKHGSLNNCRRRRSGLMGENAHVSSTDRYREREGESALFLSPKPA